MNYADYFEVVSTNDRVFHFRLKGFWSDEVMVELEKPFLTQFFQSVDSMSGQSFVTLADTTVFKTPSHKAKEAMGKAMKYARYHSLYRTVEVMPSALMKLAVKQAAQQSGEDDFRVVVSSVEEGRAKINELKKEL